MKILKKAILLIALLLFAVMDMAIYWNYHLYYRAREEDSPAIKAALLEEANTRFPWNDLVFYELGKARFDLGIGELDDAAASAAHLRDSALDFKKSISINPASPFSHFYLAQTLLNRELLFSESDVPFYDELRKAARLAGQDSQVFHEVGRIFLSRWVELSDEDKDFTLEILAKTFSKRDNHRISLILTTWELNVRDDRVLEKILPEDARVYRRVAQFLGEKSLFRKERCRYLARAEKLDFIRAKSEFQAGRLETALNLLRGIKFYQSLVGSHDVDPSQFLELKKSVYLNLAKLRIEAGAEMTEWEGALNQYLDLEDQPGNVDAVENYLRSRRVIPRQQEKSVTDLDRLALELLLLQKRGRYREIIDFGRGLERSFIVVPKPQEKSYGRILRIVGDSLYETGSLFDARDFYRKADQFDPANLETLLRLRRSYERLNDEKGLTAVAEEIENTLTPNEVDFRGRPLQKGKAFRTPLILDGRNIFLELSLGNVGGVTEPLISVFFNDRVVWDGAVQDGVISIPLGARVGQNILQITPLNGSVSFLYLKIRIA